MSRTGGDLFVKLHVISGTTIRSLIRDRGLDQQDLARSIGITPAALSMMLDGKRGVRQQYAVAILEQLGGAPLTLQMLFETRPSRSVKPRRTVPSARTNGRRGSRDVA